MTDVTDTITDTITPDTSSADRLDEVRARLEAKGMLRTATHPINLPAPQTSSPTIVLPDAGDGASGSAIVVPGAPIADVACPACNVTRPVGVNRTGFQCSGCGEGWRWAICGDCDRLALAHEGQEAWRCRGCDGLMRSWWATTLPTDEPSRIIRRRTAAVAAHVAGAVVTEQRDRERRWIVRVLAGLAAVVLLAVGAVAVHSAATSAGALPCAQFDRLMAEVQMGKVTGPAAAQELDAIADASHQSPAAAAAATAMASAARVSVAGTDFGMARTAYQDVCRGS